MKKHPHLKQAENLLKNQFHIKFLDSNVCVISIDKISSPFAHLIVQDDFDGIGLSLAMDFDETYVVAELVISLMFCAPVALAEPFYESKNGGMYWDQPAFEQFQMETDSDLLKNLQPITDSKH